MAGEGKSSSCESLSAGLKKSVPVFACKQTRVAFNMETSVSEQGEKMSGERGGGGGK